MDSIKIGQAIAQLRREKGLTQRQVAETLHVGNKAVSKWERGAGCPDAALWDGLAGLLGADLLTLLRGEVRANRPDVGKLDRVKFYVCPLCGNILVSTTAASVSCCGRTLTPLSAVPATLEHGVTVEVMDGEYYVSLTHAMDKDHFLAFAAYVHDDRFLLTRLYPEQAPAFRLPMMKRGGSLYLYCTRHGLQKCPFPERVPDSQLIFIKK